MQTPNTTYKNTEIGTIPVDWEVKTLGEIGKFTKGQGVRKDEAQSGDLPCIRYGELYTRHNDYIKNFHSFISKKISLEAKKIKFGDILFAGSGETKEAIGKCVAFINDIEAYAGGDIVILSPLNHSSLFLGFLLNTPIIQKQKASRGQGDAVVHISASQLSNIKIPLPPTLTEQTAIANALSDADALINNVEKLITKKRNIKQGAMQKLLQPKEGWEVKKLGEIAEVATGSTPPTNDRTYYGNEFFFVGPADLGKGKWIFDSEKKLTLKGYNFSRKFPKNSILFTCIGSTIGKSGIANRDLTSNQQINAIFPNETYSSEYLYYSLLILSNQIRSTAGEQAVPMINKSQFCETVIHLPPLKIQIEIAQILSDMDLEIAGLEGKLSKYRAIKTGMMQNLLTGKIRLV